MRLDGIRREEIASKLNVSLNSVSKYTANIGAPINHPLYKTKFIQHDYFSEENLEKHPERYVIIGFTAADGCVSAKSIGSRTLIYNLCEKDEIALNIINDEIAKGTRTLYYLKNTKSKILDIPSNKICDDLIKFNIVPRKTSTYDLPQSISIENMRYFLRGLIYGDGCLHRYPNRLICSLVCTSKFANSLREFVISNDIVSHAWS